LISNEVRLVSAVMASRSVSIVAELPRVMVEDFPVGPRIRILISARCLRQGREVVGAMQKANVLCKK